jgi:hypothetical protein
VLCIRQALTPPLNLPSADLRRLPGLSACAGTSTGGSSVRVEVHGDVLLAMPQGISIADVSLINPSSLNTLSRAAGAAASHRYRHKQTAYARVKPNVYSVIPFSVELYGRLGHPGMKLVDSLAVEAAGPGVLWQASVLEFSGIFLPLSCYWVACSLLAGLGRCPPGHGNSEVNLSIY